MIKKIISAAAGAGMMLAVVSPAFAANTCGNLTTGPTSTNLCNTILSKMKTLTLNNTGSVNHLVTKNAVSGNNVVDTNTSIGTVLAVDSGSSSADVTSIGQLNTGDISISQTDPVADHVGLNDTTGPDSSNTANVTNNKTATTTIVNGGTLTHTVNVNAQSGFNIVRNNTIIGGIQTGGASSISGITSVMNDLILDIAQ